MPNKIAIKKCNWRIVKIIIFSNVDDDKRIRSCMPLKRLLTRLYDISAASAVPIFLPWEYFKVLSLL